MNEIIQEGKTREEALAQALEKLGVTEDQVEVEEIEGHRDRFFGLLSAKGVKIKVTIKETPEAIIKVFVSTVLEKMGVAVNVEVERQDTDIIVNLDGDDAGMIIGKFGQTLDNLQYLSNIVLAKSTRDKLKVTVNVGDYRTRREESLRRMAKAMAGKVLKSRKSITLAPMSPQDRRIIHIALSTFKNVATTSEGVGHNRRVVISFSK
jgi:spoIIIJ-associated protein